MQIGRDNKVWLCHLVNIQMTLFHHCATFRLNLSLEIVCDSRSPLTFHSGDTTTSPQRVKVGKHSASSRARTGTE